ncbi:MAG: phosphatase PAP2 family protein [Clostridiales bacterium]|nr:phosphatase PAP2 family protein [Clostridiales bacterium]
MSAIDTVLNALIGADGKILLLIQEYIRIPELSPWVVRFTKLGNMGAIWIVIAILLLIPRKTRRAGILAIVSLIGSFCLVNLFLKGYVNRVRPAEVVSGLNCLITTTDASFPSGHAAAGFAAATAIYKSTHKWVGVPCVVLAVLLSFSRLYVGAHYPSDVICGAIIGFLIGLIVFWLFGEKKYKRRARRARRF